MKKGTRVSQKKFCTSEPRFQQMRMGSNMRGLLIVAACCVSFISIIGIIRIASAASSGAPTLAQKMQGFQQLIQDGRAHALPKPLNQKAPLAQSVPTRPAGIINMRQGPFPQSTFAVFNFWQGPVGKDWILAYAGTKKNTDSTGDQGGIVLYTETVNNQGGFDLHLLGTFLAPQGTTALTITAQQGDLLLLLSETDKQQTFNLVSHQFQ